MSSGRVHSLSGRTIVLYLSLALLLGIAKIYVMRTQRFPARISRSPPDTLHYYYHKIAYTRLLRNALSKNAFVFYSTNLQTRYLYRKGTCAYEAEI